ncbi:MAG: selenium metabolism-associated LysR family transcriptional regulator [Isosphaeraceae bacterium]
MSHSSSLTGREELPHLSTFVRVAEQGSFTAAAAALGITQAAVSQRIAVLEKELRLALFDRQTGKIALTAAGERFYDYARRILDLHQQARRDIAGFRSAVSGELLIAASSIPGECFLPALLSAFRAEHPRVHVRATVSDSGSVITEVEKGRAPVGLIGQKAMRTNLVSRSIGSDSLALIVPAGHAWARRRIISLEALASESLIVREPGSGTRHLLETSLESAGTGLAELNVSLELGSNAAIKDAVKRGLGIAFLSRLAVQRELDAKELAAVAVRGLCLDRDFYLVYHRQRPLSPAASAFRRFVETHPPGQELASRP